MLFWFAFIVACLVIIFGVIVIVGPPYLPTLRKQINTGLDLLELQPGDTLLELGSGDGRVVLAAAKRGFKVVGIELNPLLIAFAWIITWKYRSRVRFIWGNYWGRPWPRADAIFTFMLPRYMKRLDERIEFWRTKPIRLASFAFKVPDREPKQIKDGVYLYEYK